MIKSYFATFPRSMTMTVLTVAAVRKELADLIGKVQYRRDKPVAA